MAAALELFRNLMESAGGLVRLGLARSAKRIQIRRLFLTTGSLSASNPSRVRDTHDARASDLVAFLGKAIMKHLLVWVAGLLVFAANPARLHWPKLFDRGQGRH